jgi:hypothetical protein
LFNIVNFHNNSPQNCLIVFKINTKKPSADGFVVITLKFSVDTRILRVVVSLFVLAGKTLGYGAPKHAL